MAATKRRNERKNILSRAQAEQAWDAVDFDNVEERKSDARLDALSLWVFTDPAYLVSNPDPERPLALDFEDTAPQVFGGQHGLLDEVGALGDREDNPFGFNFDEESYEAKTGDLSAIGGDRQEIALSFEDFEEEEELAVITLTKHLRDCYQVSISANRRKQALNFVFAGQESNDGVDFTTCCEVLSVRENVLKTRLMFEFYIRWIVCEDMPFLTLPLPEDLANEVIFHAGLTGLEISRMAWQNPGMRLEAICSRIDGFFSEKDLRAAAARLEQTGLLSMRGDNVYFTGRNPMRNNVQPLSRNHKKSPVIWSRLW